MITFKTDPSLTAFEMKFMMEAPDDNPRRNVRRIEVSTTNGKRTATINSRETDTSDIELDDNDDDYAPDGDDADLAAGLEDIDNSEDDGDDFDLEPTDLDDVDDTTDDTADTDGGADIAVEPTDGDGEPVADDAAPAEDGEEPPAEDTGTDIAVEPTDDADTTPDDGATPDEADSDIAVEPTGDDTADASADPASDDTGDDGDEDGEQSPEDKAEAIHKQSLYRQFSRLRDTVSVYIERLESQTGMDSEKNHQYRLILDNLHKLSDFLADFMIIKFKDVPYIQCMLFYQRSLVAVNLCLDILEKSKESTEKDVKKKRHK